MSTAASNKRRAPTSGACARLGFGTRTQRQHDGLYSGSVISISVLEEAGEPSYFLYRRVLDLACVLAVACLAVDSDTNRSGLGISWPKPLRLFLPAKGFLDLFPAGPPFAGGQLRVGMGPNGCRA
jgi:hypothetical protein